MTRAAERAGLAVLCAAGVAVWAAVDVAPTFDSMWTLIWGREIVGGELPSFRSYRAPTEHPLWLAVGALLAPLGSTAAPRALTLATVLSWVAALAGLYRLGRATVGAAAGALAVVLLATRLDFPFWAAVGFVDVPYLALLVWAAALEAERPRRGGAVWVLLVAAGLLRPEAWLFAAAYAVWLSWGRPRRAWLGAAGWVVLPMALWALVDLVVTGHPTYSFTMSTDHAAELQRTRSVLDLPRSTLSSAAELVKPPVLALGAAGLVAALALLRGSRRAVPVALLALGTAGFLVVSATGFSVIPRYFATAALALTLLAAFALTGWTALPSGAPGRRAWMAGAATAVLLGGAWQAARLHPARAGDDLDYRALVVRELNDVVGSPAVARGRACGPLSLPNHLLQPYAIWALDVPVGAVVARTDAVAGRPRSGAAIITLTPRLNAHPAFGVLNARLRDPVAALLPPPGFTRAAVTPRFSTYVGC